MEKSLKFAIMKKIFILVACAVMLCVDAFAQINFWNKIFKTNNFQEAYTILYANKCNFYVKTIDYDQHDGTSYDQMVGMKGGTVFVVKSNAIGSNNLKSVSVTVGETTFEAVNKELSQLGYKKFSDRIETEMLFGRSFSCRVVRYWYGNIVVKVKIYNDAPGTYQINFSWK